MPVKVKKADFNTMWKKLFLKAFVNFTLSVDFQIALMQNN